MCYQFTLILCVVSVILRRAKSTRVAEPHANRFIFWHIRLSPDHRIWARAHTLGRLIDGRLILRDAFGQVGHLPHEYVEYKLFSGHSFECVN